MKRSEYELAICEQLKDARVIPFEAVSIDAEYPVLAKCHENVNRWVSKHPTHRAVRGWVVWKPCLFGMSMGIELTAHSVVSDENGRLFDITPLSDDRVRPSMRFVAHNGSDASFFEFKRSNRCICCPDSSA